MSREMTGQSSIRQLMSPIRQLMPLPIAFQTFFLYHTVCKIGKANNITQLYRTGREVTEEAVLKIEINIDEMVTDMEIVVTCNKLTPKVEKILAALRMMDCQLIGKKGDEIHLLDIAQIIYIESVERKCFVYTADDVYESDFPLYELERQLAEYGFLRVSKSFLIHLPSIQSLKADLNRRIRITMVNGEQIIASRQYADSLKKRLGVK